MSEAIESLTQELQDVRAKMEQHSQRVWTEYLQGWMKQHPEVKAINWKQYTPSWNDGDACTFQVCDPSILMNPDVEGYEEEEDDEWSYYRWDPKFQELHPTTWQSFVELSKLFERNEETLMYAFGDGASVVLTTESIDVREYWDE